MSNATDTAARDLLPLSPEQRACLARSGHAPAARLMLARMASERDGDALRAALNRVVASHPALRLRFFEVPGYRGLRQQPDGDAAWTWEVVAGQGKDPHRAVQAWHGRVAAQPGLHAAWFTGAGQGGWLALAATPLIADEGSMLQLLNDVARALEPGLAPRAMPDPDAGEDAPFDYTHYVLWRQELAADPEGEPGRAYWREQGEASGLEAPRLSYRATGAAQDSAALAICAADASAAHGVTQLAQRLDLPVETVLHAAWLALLGRLTGGYRHVTGWRHDCRADYDMLAGAVGAYEKVLPLAVDWQADDAFEHCARQLAERRLAHIGAQEHYPLAADAASRHQEVGFAAMPQGLPGAGVAAVRWECGAGPADFDLALQVVLTPAADQVAHLQLAYAPHRYGAAAVRGLLAQYLEVLAQAAGAPETPLSRLLPPAAPDTALYAGETWDAGAQPLLAQVLAWAARTPSAPAIVDEGETLDYAALAVRVDQAARVLAAQGVTAGAVVALRLPRGADLIVALLAAWRCGAAYLPLDPQWPEARCAALMQDASAACVVQRPQDASPFDGVARVTLGAGVSDAALPALNDAALLRQPAYVLYTSGSTGAPKGVAVGQRALLNYVAGVTRAMGLDQARRWALTATVAADLGNTALFGALYNGAALVIAGEADVQDAQSFSHFLGAQRIDAIKMVPSHLAALLDCDGAAAPRTVILGGEATSAALVRRIFQLTPDCRLFNHYGPTESTVGVMVHAVTAAADAGAGGVLPLTRALPGCRIRLLDADLTPTAQGALGQVYIGGAQLANGYLRASGDDAFIDDPYLPGQRLYRSGDLAYALPDGGIRLAGRADHQVKVRGFRIEPAEIEAALLSLPGVQQAAVLAMPGAAGVELTACVTVDETHPPQTDADLRAALAALLPAPMLPSRIQRQPDLPRLPNGKVDRHALQARVVAVQDAAPTAPVAPRDALETVLAGCVAVLLERDSVGVHDDFFSLGGHSLLVIKLVTRLRKQLRVEAAPGLVFDHPTVARLATALRQQAEDPAQLDQIAQLRVQLNNLSPQERAALAAQVTEPA
ncbi:amino acid adenylation domain-containing protein [Achromobacter sp. MFA1 R4]|uniref:amino acid adenylation domain-containing protein n=1 Tax=Achromobacter sp. MFA1 R4 TaxID=1881016 RepID=UPI000953816F|nr:amino acid adenylation domain-containing protein [Achromobacter sp. MFA1 R4]SIT01199.1 amino acid adenylation domain-containing protein [Achromobacter sp. MFA1 R4]